MKRTRGIEQFEFISIEDATRLIEMHRAERRLERRKRHKKEAKEAREAKDRLKQLESHSRASKSRLSQGEKNTEEWIRATDEVRGLGVSTMSDTGGSPRISQEILRPASQPNPLAHPEKSISIDFRPEEKFVQHDDPSISGKSDPEKPKGASDQDIDDLASTVISFHVDEPLNDRSSKSRQTNVLITISGWVIYSEDDHSLPYTILQKNIYGDQYTLIWETEALKDLGSALKILVGEIASFIVQQGIQGTL